MEICSETAVHAITAETAGPAPARAGGRFPGNWAAAGEAVTACMREAGLSQKELAAASGVSDSTIRMMANVPGKHRQSARTLSALSQALGRPPDYLRSVLLPVPGPGGLSGGIFTAFAEAPAGCMPPPGFLTVICLEEMTGHELADRRAMLLRALGPAERGVVPGALAAALALAAVCAEQDSRARVHAGHSGRPYLCSCGLRFTGLAAIDGHLDTSGPGSGHEEMTGISLPPVLNRSQPWA